MSDYKLTDEQWDALCRAAPYGNSDVYVSLPTGAVSRPLIDRVLTLVGDVLGMTITNREPLTDEEWERMPGGRHGCLRWFSSGEKGEGFWLSRDNLNILRHFGVTVEPPPAKLEPRYVVKEVLVGWWYVYDTEDPHGSLTQTPEAGFRNKSEADHYCDAKNEEDC
jgi:hypothetical protein